MCPFCYIGKRRFELALEQFSHKNDIRVEWKSFQLNPAMKTEPGKSINEYLAEIKGWPIEQAKELNDQVTQMASDIGLQYDFDKAVVANSFDAHRLIQFAKVNSKGDIMEELLFNAYFTEGKNIADHSILAELANDAGMDKEAVLKMRSFLFIQ
jgi:predicted DsbA family dithiol-disulfide isomerase